MNDHSGSLSAQSGFILDKKKNELDLTVRTRESEIEVDKTMKDDDF